MYYMSTIYFMFYSVYHNDITLRMICGCSWVNRFLLKQNHSLASELNPCLNTFGLVVHIWTKSSWNKKMGYSVPGAKPLHDMMTSSNWNIFRVNVLWRGTQRSPVNSPSKGKWRGALMFSFNCPWTNGWINNSEAGDLKRHLAHYDVIVMN